MKHLFACFGIEAVSVGQPLGRRSPHPRFEEWPSLCPHSPRTKRHAARRTRPHRRAASVPPRARRAIDSNAEMRKCGPPTHQSVRASVGECQSQARYSPVVTVSSQQQIFQQGICAERHRSRICPSHPRSLARCFSRARRHIGFCFFWTPPPTKYVGSPLRKMHPRPWERGTLRVASRKSVPRAIRANSIRS